MQTPTSVKAAEKTDLVINELQQACNSPPRLTRHQRTPTPTRLDTLSAEPEELGSLRQEKTYHQHTPTSLHISGETKPINSRLRRACKSPRACNSMTKTNLSNQTPSSLTKKKNSRASLSTADSTDVTDPISSRLCQA